jgi:hypothetical protein
MSPVFAPVARLLFTGLALASATIAGAQSDVIQRCESKDGRVTYSNTTCPSGTTPVRKVNTEPPISVDDRKAAQERARKEGAAAKQAETEKAQQEARDRKQVDERAKADAKAKERCENARRELERSRASRGELNARPSTPEKIEKAESDIKRRESEVARECSG